MIAKFQDNRIAYEAQIRSMCKDGKTYEDIQAFFSDEYGIKIYANDIIRAKVGTDRPIISADGKFTVTPGAKRGKRKYCKKAMAGNSVTVIYHKGGLCQYTDLCKFKDRCKPEICKFL
jgi:hypothetical protein